MLDVEREKREAATAESTNEAIITPKSKTPGVPETTAVEAAPTEPELSEEQLAAVKLVGYYPTCKEGAAGQLFGLLKTYFGPGEHSSLEKLLLDDEAPSNPLLFRGSATQLADAFKQLKEANLIVGCRMSDLKRWIAPKFLYLSPQSQPRELPEDYLNGLMSTKGRPCKSPILKIEQKEDKFFILPAPAAKKAKK